MPCFPFSQKVVNVSSRISGDYLTGLPTSLNRLNNTHIGLSNELITLNDISHFAPNYILPQAQTFFYSIRTIHLDL